MIVFSIQALHATNSDKGLKDNNRENSEDKHHRQVIGVVTLTRSVFEISSTEYTATVKTLRFNCLNT